MLVLSRKEKEFVVAGEVVFQIVEIRKNHVKLAITAPRHINISRPASQKEGTSDELSQTGSSDKAAA